MYEQVPVSLSAAQYQKLCRGHPIQLASHQISGQGLKNQIAVHPTTAKKIHTARMKQKGVRITMTPHEMECSGEGLKEFWDKLKNAGQFIKNKIIDTPFYQQTIRPIAKNLVNQGIDTFVPAPARDVAHQASSFVGEKTGAFGIRAGKRRGRKPKATHPAMVPSSHQTMASHYELQDGQQTFLNPMHPAMHPPIPYLPGIGGAVKKNTRQIAVIPRGKKGRRPGTGGSFRPA